MMVGTIVAINALLGTLVVEVDDQTCVVLESPGHLTMEMGDQVDGDWKSEDRLTVKNITRNEEFLADIQLITKNRSEAIGSMSLL